MKIIDSVAAVFCHNEQVFAVRRQSYLDAFPGYDSFPGGKIDRDDSDHPHPAPFLSELDGRSMHALVREAYEELGYDLPAGIYSGEVSAIKYLATTLAPAISPLRFRLHFFRIDLISRPQFTIDTGEIAAVCWQTPQQLLDSFDAGDALMVPPLRRMLKQLHQNPMGYNFGDLSPQFDENNYVPKLELLSGLRMLPVPSNTFPPEKRTTAFLLGDEGAPKILVDPSPESPQVLKKLLRTLWLQNLTAILLTHHHHDHHEHAPALAAQLKLPIWMSEDTHHRITQKYGSDYFAGVRIGIKQAGDCLTTWKGESVRVYAIPGHDAGQLGLAPESLRWFLVGDLIQSFGTVVISAPEGNMTTYFQTLEKLIGMNPAVIVPSHGMPMRSTYRLQATLQHRRDREMEIHEIYNSGKNKMEILDIIYPEIDAHLVPFAMCNIESHLTKLCDEGKIFSSKAVTQ